MFMIVSLEIIVLRMGYNTNGYLVVQCAVMRCSYMGCLKCNPDIYVLQSPLLRYRRAKNILYFIG